MANKILLSLHPIGVFSSLDSRSNSSLSSSQSSNLK